MQRMLGYTLSNRFSSQTFGAELFVLWQTKQYHAIVVHLKSIYLHNFKLRGIKVNFQEHLYSGLTAVHLQLTRTILRFTELIYCMW